MDGLGFGLTRAEWGETAVALGLVLLAVAVARLLAAALRWAVHHVTRAVHRDLDEALAGALRGPLVLLVFVQALFLALGTLSYLEPHQPRLERAWLAATVAIFTLAGQRIVSRLIAWTAARPSATGRRLDTRTAPLVRRGVSAAIFLVGAIIVLDTLGVQISPLLAGLGIGGLAVALALQPLLANLFASSYMLSDASVRVGDQIEVAGGPSGRVEDIGWRATRLRNADNNIVIVPNSLLAGSVVTNYSAGDPSMDARVELGVTYDVDLAHVAGVLAAEARRVRDADPGAVPGVEPLVRFTRFAEPYVEVTVRLRARGFAEAGALRHELMQRLHARLATEGVTMRPGSVKPANPRPDGEAATASGA